jgi:dihydrofolate synthase/folylpolyglutamate synthase
MFLEYSAVLDYLYKNLPMFQRVGAVAYKADLLNTLALCEALGNPQRAFKSVHVAGTNGKGSTSHMLASVFQSAGYKTGLYTSPHLKEFTERIRINGSEVEKTFVVDFVNRIRPHIETIQPSFFEITVAMAFDYFAQQQVDIAIIEVGLGGRLDSTNVITPELCVITNISWDHKDILGDTLEKIAAEKAGIIKPHVPVVISTRQPGIDTVFIEKAATEAAPIFFASDEYEAFQKEYNGTIVMDVTRNDHTTLEKLALPLQGHYQRKNVPGVYKAIELLRRQGWSISEEQLRDGLERVITQTGLKGRWQKLQDKPLTICDTGHNIDGVQEIVDQLLSIPFRQLHVVLGMVKDKDIQAVLDILPKNAIYYFCQATIPRALAAMQLAAQARTAGLSGHIVPDVNAAIRKARAAAQPDDLIFIGGSTFVVAEIDEL